MRGQRPERLIARHDVSNEEAMRYVEERLRTLGVIKALEAAGLRARGRRGDRRHRLRAPSRCSVPVEVSRCPAPPSSLALAVLALASCGGSGSDGDDPEQVVRDFVEATNDRDSERLCEELLSPEFIAESTGRQGGGHGHVQAAARQP